jgi:hypothetical protein
MRTSEQINELATALAKAQAEMKNAKLNKVNPHFKSRYADLAEIRDTVTPSLSKNGIAVVHGMDAAESGIHVVTRLIHSSGQWIESRFPIAYDKPQTMGSAITYGRRYNLSAIANISADDDDDANAATQVPKQQATPPQPKAKPEMHPNHAQWAKAKAGSALMAALKASIAAALSPAARRALPRSFSSAALAGERLTACSKAARADVTSPRANSARPSSRLASAWLGSCCKKARYPAMAASSLPA